MKLNPHGNIEWQKCLGGQYIENAYSIRQTSDGGYIVAGETASDDGDVSGRHSNSTWEHIYGPTRDIWVVKLSSGGVVEWQKCLGGTGDEMAYSIQQTTDGGYIVTGFAGSFDGDVSGAHGNHSAWMYDWPEYADCWVVKLSSGGVIEWQKCLGGSAHDFADSIRQTTDGKYIVAGTSYSNDGDVSGNHGDSDYWIVQLNSLGAIEWQRSLGGTGDDEPGVISEAIYGGYIVAGYSNSNDGDVSENHGDYDAWIVRVNATGDIIWEKSLGGLGRDMLGSIQQTGDWGYIVGGYSESNDGNVSGNHGNGDFWVVQLNMDYYWGTINPIIGFTADQINGTTPCTVQFNDTSYLSPNWWYWEFGDGTHSLDQNPVHIYTTPGRYNVSLAVRNLTGQNWTEKIQFITVTNPPYTVPVPNFTATNTSVSRPPITSGPLPHMVRFIDTSDCLNPLSWNWSFGDGAFSTSQTPVHEYLGPGNYTVSLNVTNASGSATLIRSGFICVSPRGDFNTNNRVDVGDLTLISYMAVGLIPTDSRADFNNDGFVNSGDAAKIAWYYVGKITEF